VLHWYRSAQHTMFENVLRVYNEYCTFSLMNTFSYLYIEEWNSVYGHHPSLASSKLQDVMIWIVHMTTRLHETNGQSTQCDENSTTIHHINMVDSLSTLSLGAALHLDNHAAPTSCSPRSRLRERTTLYVESSYACLGAGQYDARATAVT